MQHWLNIVKNLKGKRDTFFDNQRNELFICEGFFLVERAVEWMKKGKLSVYYIAGTSSLLKKLSLDSLSSIQTIELTETELDELVGFKFHRGIFALVKVPPSPSIENLYHCQKILVLPELQGFDNLGALLRSAYALSVDGVLIGKGPSLFDRRTVRVSMGASWMIPTWKKNDPLLFLQQWKKLTCGQIIAAALHHENINLSDWKPANKTALILGPEGNGLSQEWLQVADKIIKIPIREDFDSLNVAAAGAILINHMTQF